MNTDTAHTWQDTITITLTPYEAHALWLAIDANTNTLARKVDTALRAYAKRMGASE